MQIVHIGIVSYNSLDDISACVAAVRSQTYPDWRLTVFDNASSDGTRAWLAQHLETHQFHINDKNLGYGAAHNRIIQTIGEAHYLALNPDAVLEKNFVEELLNALETHQAGWVCGKLLSSQNPTYLYSVGHAVLRGGYAFNIGSGCIDDNSFATEREVFGAPGAAVLYSHALVRALEPQFFDERFFLYGEDVDVDWRSQKLGFQCWYTPKAIAKHRGSQANQDLKIMALANRYLVCHKNASWSSLIFYNIPLMILHILIRFIISPHLAWQLFMKIWQNVPEVWCTRQASKAVGERMTFWFAWSRKQKTRTPRSIPQRIRAYFRAKAS